MTEAITGTRKNPRSLIESGRLSHPGRTALTAPGRSGLTYDGLAGVVSEVAGRLSALGLGPGDRVAVVLENGPEMASTFLGVASCATCAPLNPAYGVSELEFYLADLDARAVVVTAGSGANAPAVSVAKARGLTVLEVSAGGPEAGRLAFGPGWPSEGLAPRWSGPSEVALLLHTSGTTARPKLVPLSRANLEASARNVAESLALGPSDVCLNVMPLFHIHGLVAGLLASLSVGASVACCPGFAAPDFFEWLNACGATWYSAVPTIHQAVLGRINRHPEVVDRLRLRLIRSSSAALPPQVMAELEAAFGAPVIEAYGMTEAAHQMASNALPPGDRLPGTVGRAAGPELAVVDAEGRPQPIGAVGEVVIRGPNVTAGYLANPDANRDGFFGDWFRTGDQGFLDARGTLTLTGRLKELINRGGEKVAPREVDEVLLDHPGVARALAFAVPHPNLGEDVAAAVVLREEANVSEQDLREFAFTRLAAFKVPSQIVFVDAIPQGPTGKPTRIGLHEKLRDKMRRVYVVPRTEMEERLKELWVDVLTIDEIGVHDNFFGLGGDSLSAGRLVARINSRFELGLPVTIVFHAPSIEAQATLVESALLDEIEGESRS